MGWLLAFAGTCFGIDALFHHVHDYPRYAIAGGFVLAGIIYQAFVKDD